MATWDASVWSVGHSSDDFADLVAGFEVAVGVDDVVEREGAVDDGGELPSE